MWVENALRPRTLPVAVSRKRFLAPEWVFILGIVESASKADAWRRSRAVPAGSGGVRGGRGCRLGHVRRPRLGAIARLDRRLGVRIAVSVPCALGLGAVGCHIRARALLGRGQHRL